MMRPSEPWFVAWASVRHGVLWRAISRRFGLPGLLAAALLVGLLIAEGYVRMTLTPAIEALNTTLTQPRIVAAAPTVQPPPAVDAGFPLRGEVDDHLNELSRLAQLAKLEWSQTDTLYLARSSQSPAQVQVTQIGRAPYPTARLYAAMVLNSQPSIALTQFDLKRVGIEQTDADIVMKWTLFMKPAR